MRPLLLCALVVLANSPLVAQRGKRGCPDPVADSLSSGAPVYQACQVDREAKPRGNPPRLDWSPPTSDLHDGACFRADFRFVVDTLGFPEAGTILDGSSNNATFQQAVKDGIPMMRYEPAQLNGAPVRQVVAYHQSVAVRRVVAPSPYGGSPSLRTLRC